MFVLCFVSCVSVWCLARGFVLCVSCCVFRVVCFVLCFRVVFLCFVFVLCFRVFVPCCASRCGLVVCVFRYVF